MTELNITETEDGKYRFFFTEKGKTIKVFTELYHTRKSAKHSGKHELRKFLNTKKKIGEHYAN